MRKIALALLFVVVAVSYFGWDFINAVAAEVGHGALFSISGLFMVLGSLGLSVIARDLALQAFYGLTWEEHRNLPVIEYKVPTQAGTENWTSDKEDREATCFQVAALLFCLNMVGYLTGLSGAIAVAAMAFGYVALLGQTRKVLALV